MLLLNMRHYRMMSLWPQFLAILFVFGNVNAASFFGEDFDSDAEFVPLEQQGRRTEGEPITHAPKPFDVDVITSEVNEQQSPGIIFQHSFPFFGQDFFNSFGGFGFGPRQDPWWKGPNVCSEKTVDETNDEQKDKEQGESNGEIQEIAPGVSESVNVNPSVFGEYHFSFNSCFEKSNSYICSRIINENGKKKTITITRKCCYGYGRPRYAHFSIGCEKIDIKSVEATASDLLANKFIESAKNSGNAGDMLVNRKNQTIFLPLDKDFEKYMEKLQNENNVAESKNDGNIYLRHIVNGEISLNDVSNEQILKTLQPGQGIRINTYQLPMLFKKGGDSFRRTANCVLLDREDKLTEQGMINILRGVIKPATQNLMEIIRQRPDMSIMRTVLEKTKLSEFLEQNANPVTIFVPVDSAFDKLEPNLRRAMKEGKGCASNILRNHILGLTLCSGAVLPGGKSSAYNLLGDRLQFNRTDYTDLSIIKSEAADMVGKKSKQQEDDLIMINGIAKIIETDIMGTNGVMHVLDTILPTESAKPMLSLMQQKNITIFKNLLDAAGLDNEFNDLNNATVFAPTNKALRDTKWAKLLDESPDQLRNNPELIDFLNYHISQPMIKTCALTDATLLPTTAGPKVRINLYSTHAVLSEVMNRATVNCARLVHFDDESCGSVLHQIDKPLTPPNMNLLQILESNPAYSKFLELIRMVNLTNLLTDADGEFTLLVPKNDVFLEVDGPLGKDQAELEKLVKTHIVNDTICCAGIIPINFPFVRTIETINGLNLRISRDRRPKVENAGITKCDSIAVNGIIHEINDILVPPSRMYKHGGFPLTQDLF